MSIAESIALKHVLSPLYGLTIREYINVFCKSIVIVYALCVSLIGIIGTIVCLYLVINRILKRMKG